MPRVSEFTRDELNRRYGSTHIRYLNAKNVWVPVYVLSVYRDGTHTMLDCLPSKNLGFTDSGRVQIVARDETVDLSQPVIGYVNEDNVSGHVTRSIARSYKRGFDLGTVVYKDGIGYYKTPTGKTAHCLWNGKFQEVEEANKNVLSAAHGYTAAINKKFALINLFQFILPVIGYDGNEVGLFDSGGSRVILKKEFDWFKEIKDNPFSNYEVEMV